MKRTLAGVFAVSAISAVMTLSGCSSYTSSWKATAMVQENDSDHARISFSDFEGTMVLDLRTKEKDAAVKYDMHLDKGMAVVYYDCNGTKEQLLIADDTQDISDVLDLPEDHNNKTYIIIETKGKCEDGSFEFDLE